MPRIPRHNGPLRAGLYVRVSDAKQEEKYSLDTQLDLERAFCEQQGYQVAHVFREVHTGHDLWERPELTRARELIARHELDVFVPFSVDRFSRHQAHVYIVADECERNGVRLEFATESFEDSAVGRFLRSAHAFVAEVEREKIMERTMRGTIARFQDGKLKAGRKPPYGYLWNDTRDALQLDATTSPHVVFMFEQLLAGSNQRQVAMALTDRGVPTPEGKSTEWNHTTIGWIVKNPLYCGQPVGMRKWQARNQADPHGPQREPIPMPEGVAPAIVSPEVWVAVQEQLKRNFAQATRNNHRPEDALLRGGFVRCGVCGRALTITPARADGNPRYTCQAYRGRGGVPCPSPTSVVQPFIDAETWDAVGKFLADPETSLAERERFLSDGARTRVDVSHLDAQLAQLERQQRQLVDNLMLLSGNAAKLAAERLAQLEGSQAQIRAEQRALIQGVEQWQAEAEALRAFRELAAQQLAYLDSMDYAQRRRMLEWLAIEARIWPQDHDPRYEILAHPPLLDEPVVVSAASLTHRKARLSVRLKAGAQDGSPPKRGS